MKRDFNRSAKLFLSAFFTLVLAAAGRGEEPFFNAVWESDLAGHVEELQADLISTRSESPLDWGKTEHSGGCECNDCCPGWFVSADYLNWQVERDDLAFAIFDPTGLGVPAAGAPVMSLDLGSQSGVRGSFGRRTTSGWEVGVGYTFLSADDTQTFAPGGGRLLAVQSTPATGLTTADSVTASSDFDYHVVDLEAGHWFHPSENVSALLLGGVRFATIDHFLRASYNGNAFNNGQADVTTNIDAFGGRIGGAVHWNSGERFNVFARTSFSVLKGDVDARRREINGGAVVLDATRPSDQMLTAIDVAIGLRYFLDGWSVAGGYEWTNWFNAVSPLEFSDNFNGGTLGPAARDLGLHGFFVNATYAW